MRLVDSIYWPAVQMVMWGFMTQYLLPQASFVAQAAGVLLSGLLLWEVVVRGNLSLSIAFLEEMWSRNLGHLFVSPIRSWEMATGIIIAAFLRTLLGLVPVSLLAWAFFGYNIYTLGLPLVAFFFILQMFSWSIGLAMSGMIMRVGQSAESFAWAAVFILMPVSGVYYPVSVLPKWLQVISYGLPPAYIFEGMRAILAEKTVHWDGLAIAFGLSVVYLVIGFQIFLAFFRASRRPNESANLARNFRFGPDNRFTLQVRVEFQNVFNRRFLPSPTLGNFTTAPTVSNGANIAGFGTFGNLSTSGAFGTPRSGQFIGRLSF